MGYQLNKKRAHFRVGGQLSKTKIAFEQAAPFTDMIICTYNKLILLYSARRCHTREPLLIESFTIYSDNGISMGRGPIRDHYFFISLGLDRS